MVLRNDIRRHAWVPRIVARVITIHFQPAVQHAVSLARSVQGAPLRLLPRKFCRRSPRSHVSVLHRCETKSHYGMQLHVRASAWPRLHLFLFRVPRPNSRAFTSTGLLVFGTPQYKRVRVLSVVYFLPALLELLSVIIGAYTYTPCV